MTYKNEYMLAFERHCAALRKKDKAVLIGGDMNVGLNEIDVYFTEKSYKQPGFTYEERNSFRNFLSKGWVDTFRRLNPKKIQFTWWSSEYHNRERNQGKRLDYFLVNKESVEIVRRSVILGDVMGSDHCPIWAEINLEHLKLAHNKSESS